VRIASSSSGLTASTASRRRPLPFDCRSFGTEAESGFGSLLFQDGQELRLYLSTEADGQGMKPSALTVQPLWGKAPGAVSVPPASRDTAASRDPLPGR